MTYPMDRQTPVEKAVHDRGQLPGKHDGRAEAALIAPWGIQSFNSVAVGGVIRQSIAVREIAL